MPYYSTPDGGVAFRDEPKDGWTSISRGMYETKKAELDRAEQKRQDDVAAAKDARSAKDFDDLVGAGIPAELAARLSGHKVTN